MARNDTGYKNRAFLHLAHTYDPDVHDLTIRTASEKLDGQRCFWDGGLTAGLKSIDVPFANVEKTDRFVHEEYCTGLWSRYGHPIRAPEWYTASLPRVPLDGELYLGRKRFQDLMSITRSHDSPDWGRVKYNTFECLSLHTVFEDGCINDPNYRKVINSEVRNWVLDRAKITGVRVFEPRPLSSQEKLLEVLAPENEFIMHVKQFKTRDPYQALADIVDAGGEGLIYRIPWSYWQPRRTDNMVKLIPLLSDECVVHGFIAGKDGYIGKLGSLIVSWRNETFRLSGFNFKERELSEASRRDAMKNPGAIMDLDCGFKVGDVLTFLYKEVTDDNLPKSARYWRKWEGR